MPFFGEHNKLVGGNWQGVATATEQFRKCQGLKGGVACNAHSDGDSFLNSDFRFDPRVSAGLWD
jgi:hypothetical protein